MIDYMPIRGMEGQYEAGSDGGIYSMARISTKANGNTYAVQRRRLAPRTTKTGYFQVAFYIDGKRKSFIAHRLVLAAFTNKPPTPNDFVNHKNGIKTDNRLENLEWCNKSENAIHSYRVLGNVPTPMPKGDSSACAKPVRAVCSKTGKETMFGSLTTASNYGFTVVGISMCLIGRQKTHRGMRWSFI